MFISCLRFSLQICGKSGLTSGLTSNVVSNSSSGSKSNCSFFLDSGVFVCRFRAECLGSFVLVECGVIGVFRTNSESGAGSTTLQNRLLWVAFCQTVCQFFSCCFFVRNRRLTTVLFSMGSCPMLIFAASK